MLAIFVDLLLFQSIKQAFPELSLSIRKINKNKMEKTITA